MLNTFTNGTAGFIERMRAPDDARTENLLGILHDGANRLVGARGFPLCVEQRFVPAGFKQHRGAGAFLNGLRLRGPYAHGPVAEIADDTACRCIRNQPLFERFDVNFGFRRCSACHDGRYLGAHRGSQDAE